ncbi:uncharacterized protein AC631_04147 [Debaryomyces fabryi]|uniref:Uncharacterized protein n=1 Tax=Debaryomyces fabryi TaxID=58627 RepID=A0A0V1PUZ2_9ASCO|nr:uncharacterized protein AC631_04147 [Debaryomyces fabryi]KSA00105.1 hypothetical protein AC631_04147 [Debaryomyces fabryi]CUM56697.1 unnamed protein product [Debaryomyces fabryi]
MSRRKNKAHGVSISEEFLRLDPEIEDEILEAYSSITLESQDFFLHQLPEFLHQLQIPACFTDDITQCVNYYYEHMHNDNGDFKLNESNYKHAITFQMILAYTITGSANEKHEVTIIDIVDIDKLIRNVNKLVKFRNAYTHIYGSWKLFVDAATTSTDSSESTVTNHQLTLPDLKKIKSVLNLDEAGNGNVSLGDSFLIDMLSCCTTTENGDILNYDYNKPKKGSYITIKDFAEILGNLGELD